LSIDATVNSVHLASVEIAALVILNVDAAAHQRDSMSRIDRLRLFS
jgi:hypothetical protein